MVLPKDKYEEKFADFIKMCEAAKDADVETVIVAFSR